MNYYIIETPNSFDIKIEKGIALALNFAEQQNKSVSMVFMDYKNLDGFFSNAIQTPIIELKKKKAFLVNNILFELISSKELKTSSLQPIILCIFPNSRLLNELEKIDKTHEIIVPWISDDVKKIKAKKNVEIL